MSKQPLFKRLGTLMPASLLSLALPIAPLPALSATSHQVADLKAQLAAAQQDAHYWRQLNALMMPVKMVSMTDHRAYMLPSGVILALHFDNMDLRKAKNLNWIALGIPGKFCKADQDRVERQYGPGFTHFHSLQNDTHGGDPGAQGVWFVHVGARDFTSPFGQVKTGAPDSNFMPTPAPEC